MNHLEERISAQRETCYRICSGLWIRKPSIPYMLTMLTIACGAIYAFWSVTAASQQRITTIEIHQIATDSALVSLRSAVYELKSGLENSQDQVVQELKALRKDLKIRPAKGGGL